MMQWKQWRWVLLALVFGCAVVLTNCGNPSNSAKTENSGVLVFGSGGQPVNLEPGNIADGNSIIVQDQIYNRLLEFKPGTTELEPALATEWKSSEGGKVWTFKLRSPVKFHDGSDLNAEAVKFNLERWWDPQHPYGYRNAGKNYDIWKELFGGFKGDRDSLLQELLAPDSTTIQFALKRPFAAFPAALATGYFGIASPTAIKKAGASYGTAGSIAVGTGAFTLQDWRTGDRIVLSKNANYWKKDLPRAAQLAIRFVADPAARLAQIRAAQLDFTVDLAPDQKQEIQSDPNLEIVARPSFNVGYLALNPSYKPLSDRKVRQAIAQAINKQAIVQAFWGDLAISDSHFLPPSLSWAEASNLKDREYDPQQAKQLLTEAGYPRGFDLELWYIPVSRPYFPTPKPIAEAFAADLSAIGIRVQLKTKDWAAYLSDRKKAPGFQAFMLGWTGDYGDPDNFYYPHFGPGSTSDLGGWRNERLLQLLDRGRETSDKATRVKIYAEIDEILHRELVRLPIVHSQPLLVKRKSVEGWVPSPLGSEPFEAVVKK